MQGEGGGSEGGGGEGAGAGDGGGGDGGRGDEGLYEAIGKGAAHAALLVHALSAFTPE